MCVADRHSGHFNVFFVDFFFFPEYTDYIVILTAKKSEREVILNTGNTERLKWALALVYQKNDIYSGLGDDSSTTLDAQGAQEQNDLQKTRHEAKEFDMSEDIEEGPNAGGGSESRERPGDPIPTVSVSSKAADQPLGATEERYGIGRSSILMCIYGIYSLSHRELNITTSGCANRLRQSNKRRNPTLALQFLLEKRFRQRIDVHISFVLPFRIKSA